MKLYDTGVYLHNGKEIIPAAEAQLPVSREDAARNTIAYSILKAHNTCLLYTSCGDHEKRSGSNFCPGCGAFLCVYWNCEAVDQRSGPFYLVSCF